jgi:hypothetical protein
MIADLNGLGGLCRGGNRGFCGLIGLRGFWLALSEKFCNLDCGF